MLIIAHRGFAQKAQQNTLDAIEQAREIGADMIEVDIRVTSDNIPVLHHDNFMPNNSKKVYISQSTYQELVAIDNRLTTLGQALSLKDIKYLLEIKPGVKTGPIIQCLKEYGHQHNLIIASFDYKILRKVKNELPKMSLAVLDKWSGVRSSHRAKKLGTKIIIINQRWLWGGFIRSVINSGYTLYTYTLNNSAKSRKWQRQGLAGVITDVPDKFI